VEASALAVLLVVLGFGAFWHWDEVYADPKDYLSSDALPRALAQYLYSGVTTVKSVA
jgi:hypothetical protein